MYEGLADFVARQADTVDFFCFQEVYKNASESLREAPETRLNLYDELKSLLPKHDGYFMPQVTGTGIATFVRKEFGIEETSERMILTAEELAHFKMPDGNAYYPRPLLRVGVREPHIVICNVHGAPGSAKKDTPERELQTTRIIDALTADSRPKILAGDFNLNPETRAIAALDSLMQNPLKGSDYATTRSRFYERKEELPFADYIFVSPELQIKRFEVLSDEVSDHLPLLLDFEY
jgi:endonuclease/exonuclease/phosphatase family metal-dependent hydrolase